MYASLKWVIIGSDNGLSPVRRQNIIWTNAGILLTGPWETNFSELLIGIQTLSFKKLHLNMSSAKWRLFCLGHNILRRMANCGAHISFSELKGQIQEKPNINKYCGMLQYNTNSKLSHKNFLKMFLWTLCKWIDSIVPWLVFHYVSFILFMWNVCSLLSVQCYR